MSIRDGYTGFKFFEMLKAGVYNESMTAAGGSASGTALDTQGYETATILINVGSASTTNAAASHMHVALMHADIDDSFSYAFVSTTDLFGSVIAFNSEYVLSFGGSMQAGLTSASGVILDFSVAPASIGDANSQYVFGYKGKKRYLQLIVDSNGTGGTGSAALCAIGILGLPANWPVNVAHP